MRKLLLLWTGCLFICMHLQSQNRVISGTVTDEKGIPLPNVSVVVKNTSIGTTTDINGNYKITVPPSARSLVFSSVGQDQQEISIGNKSDISVALSQKGSILTEVVVTSLGITRDKRSLGYA